MRAMMMHRIIAVTYIAVSSAFWLVTVFWISATFSTAMAAIMPLQASE